MSFRGSMSIPILAMVLVFWGCANASGPSISKPSTKDITAFAFVPLKVVATISDVDIAATLPAGTAVNALVATFSTSGAKVEVGSVTQVSGVTANDFTNPVSYLVTAEDGSTKTYTVTVTVPSGGGGISVVSPPGGSVTLSGQVTPLSSGATMTVTATATGVPTSYAWYVDGVRDQTQSTAVWKGGASLKQGPHSLALVVEVQGVLYSASFDFRVQ